MKPKLFSVIALMVAILTGCVNNHYHPTEPVARMGPHTGFMVVNNSGALINVIQDGQVVAERIEPGQVVPIRPVWMRTSCVVAVGYTPGGEYVGSDSYTFQSGVRETWTVHRLLRPQTNLAW